MKFKKILNLKMFLNNYKNKDNELLKVVTHMIIKTMKIIILDIPIEYYVNKYYVAIACLSLELL